MRLRAPAIVSAAVLALTLAGCGSEDTGDAPASAESTSTAPVFDPEVYDEKAAPGDSARVGQAIRAFTAAKDIKRLQAGAKVVVGAIEDSRAETGKYPTQEGLAPVLNDRPKGDQDILGKSNASYAYKTTTADTWTMDVTNDDIPALKVSYKSGEDEPVIEGVYTAPKVTDPIETKEDLYNHAGLIIQNKDATNGLKGAYELESVGESQGTIDKSVADGLAKVAKEHGVTVHVVSFKDANATYNLAAEGVGVISINLDDVYAEMKPEDFGG